MNIKYILLTIIILLVLYLLSYHNEHLDYDENTFMTLEEQQLQLDLLLNKYDNSVPEDEKITDDFDERDKMLRLL
jgi:hypothetical protein